MIDIDQRRVVKKISVFGEGGSQLFQVAGANNNDGVIGEQPDGGFQLVFTDGGIGGESNVQACAAV